MANEILAPLPCKRVGEGLYSVGSETQPGVAYTVDLNAGTCQCPHHLHRIQGKSSDLCKHQTAARARCAQVVARKARTIPDVEIDELAARYDGVRPEIAAVLYDEIRRRTTASPPAAVPPHVAEVVRIATAPLTERELKAIFS